MLCLRHLSDCALLMLLESSSLPFAGLGGFNRDEVFELGVEGDCRLGGPQLCLRAEGECCNLMERLAVLFTVIWSELGSLSVGIPFSQGRVAIHRSSQLQPQRGIFGSMNVWFVEFDEFLHVCW